MSARHAPSGARKRSIKARLIDRDGLSCFYCGTPFATAADATIDHLVPLSALPGWHLANLVLACEPCNQAKGGTIPQAFLRPAGYGPGLVPVAPRPEHAGATGGRLAEVVPLFPAGPGTGPRGGPGAVLAGAA